MTQLFSKETIAGVKERLDEKGIEGIETKCLFIRITHHFSHTFDTLLAIEKIIATGVWVIAILIASVLILK